MFAPSLVDLWASYIFWTLFSSSQTGTTAATNNLRHVQDDDGHRALKDDILRLLSDEKIIIQEAGVEIEIQEKEDGSSTVSIITDPKTEPMFLQKINCPSCLDDPPVKCDGCFACLADPGPYGTGQCMKS